MPKSDFSHPVWDLGEPLPAENELFVYNKTGKLYYWRSCDCGNIFCNRPLVYSADGTKDRAMTIRMRGDDSGLSQVKVLIAVGFTVAQIADKIDDGVSVSDQLRPFVKDLATDADRAAFASRYHIDQIWVDDAINDLDEESMFKGLEDVITRLFFGRLGNPPRKYGPSRFSDN